MNLLVKIYEKIKNLFNKLLKRENVLLIEESQEEFSEFIYEDDEQELYSKEDYFRIYDNIKKGIISPEDLMLNDLIKIMAIMNEELTILEKKVVTNENELQQINTRIDFLNKEKKRLESML